VSEIDNCKHCGGKAEFKAIIAYSSYPERDEGFVRCQECGASTGRVRVRQEAISAWNRRADGWISVKERLPEPYTHVLCHAFGNVFVAMRDKDGWMGLEYANEYITHWMPLPQPPEESK